MRLSRPWLGVPLLAAALLVPASALSADTRLIGAGVSAGGIDVSGLTVTDAAARLSSALAPRYAGTVVLGLAGHVFRLAPRQARFRFDALKTARRAYLAGASRQNSQPVDVAPALGYSLRSLASFATGVAKRTDRAAVDATVDITVHHIHTRAEREGHHVDRRVLIHALGNALQSTRPSARVIHMRVVRDRARVDVRRLADIYSTVVTVDRSAFRLRLFKHLRFAKSYPVAVGMAGLATPAGIYHVSEREVDPSWHVPNSSWAGSLAGHTVPPGPADPIKARWLGLGGGVGIHGTAEDWSIGSRASHGCIRMHVADVIALYSQVPLGTAVLIH